MMATCNNCIHHDVCEERGEVMFGGSDEKDYLCGAEALCEHFKACVPKKICRMCGKEYYSYSGCRSSFCSRNCGLKYFYHNNKNKISGRGKIA